MEIRAAAVEAGMEVSSRYWQSSTPGSWWGQVLIFEISDGSSGLG